MSIPPLEEQEGFEEFTDTPRQKRVRAQLKGDSKEEKMKDRLLEIADLVTRIPAALLQTKEGVGVAAILLGTGLKEVGLKTGIDLWPFDTGKDNPLTKITDIISGKGLQSPFDNDVSLLKVWAETPVGKAILDRLFPNRNEEGAEPINETDLMQAADASKSGNFGFIPVADALIWGGFLALSAEAIKGLGEVIPL